MDKVPFTLEMLSRRKGFEWINDAMLKAKELTPEEYVEHAKRIARKLAPEPKK